MADQVYQLNGKVREINSKLGIHSSEFSSDIQTNKRLRCFNSRIPKKKKPPPKKNGEEFKKKGEELQLQTLKTRHPPRRAAI